MANTRDNDPNAPVCNCLRSGRAELGGGSTTPAEEWSTFLVQSLLGNSLFGQDKFAAAEELLLSGYRGLKEREQTIPVPFRNSLDSNLKCLVDLYKTWDKPEEAARRQAELDARFFKSAAGRSPGLSKCQY